MKYPLSWQNNLDVSLSSTKCIVLTGNIHDCSFLVDADRVTRGSDYFKLPIIDVVCEIAKNATTRGGRHYDEFLVYNPQLEECQKSVSFRGDASEEQREIHFASISNLFMNYDALIDVAQGCGNGDAYCLVLELFNVDSQMRKQEIYNRVLALFRQENVNPNFTLILLDTQGDEDGNGNFAAPFVKECPFAKMIEIPKPGYEVIRKFLSSTICTYKGNTSSPSVISSVVGMTDGFYGIQYRDLAHYFASYNEDITAQEGKIDVNDRLYFARGIDMYLNGSRENRWDKSMTDFNNRAEVLLENIEGQEEVKQKVVSALRKAVQGFGAGADGNNIRGCLVFAGPTGTGKTFTARQMANAIFDSEDYLIRVDMANYQDETGVNSLLGVGAGYVGHNSTPQFIKDIKEKGSAILLFDEFEKAHPKMFDLFLQMLDSGYITDHASGKRTSLKDIFIVMTTNKGAKETSADAVRGKIESFFSSEVNRPEIFGRIGRSNVLVFKSLEKKNFYKMFVKEFMKTEAIIKNRYPGIKFDRPDDETAVAFVDKYWQEPMTPDEQAQLAETQKRLDQSYEAAARRAQVNGLPAPKKEDYTAKIERGIADLGGRGLKDKMSEVVYNEISDALSRHELAAGDSFNRNEPLHVGVNFCDGKVKAYVERREN